MTTLSVFIFIAGFIVGLGAVSVIETLGFLGRHSPYWTEATIRAHKVTKPLIWLGLVIAVTGGVLTYQEYGIDWHARFHAAAAVIMVINGSFLSFWISPRLLERERRGQATSLLPASWQRAITVSFFISMAGWWGSVYVLADLLTRP